MSGSMLYTMGLALTRAADLGYDVSVLVEGQWMHGRVAAHDGVGLVLEQEDDTHTVIRAERIAAVNVHSASPVHQQRAPSGYESDVARPLVAAAS